MALNFANLKTEHLLPAHYKLLSQRERAQVRQQYIKLQDGFCWFCKDKLDGPANAGIRSKKLNMRLFPKGFLDNPIHLHHDHNTGLTIGAVHAYCNGYLWQYLGE